MVTRTTLNRATGRLVVPHDRLVDLARWAGGVEDPPDDPDDDLVAAGLVVDGVVDAMAGDLARVAVVPFRATVVERFDGQRMSPLFVAWVQDGRATLSEPDEDGNVVVTATNLQLVPALVLQFLALQRRPDPTDLAPVRTTTAVLDGLLSGAPEGASGSGDDERLAQIVESFRLGWRASGGWGAETPDARVTVVDAGLSGLWRVDHPDRDGDEVVDVTLQPVTVAEVTASLGDVVTGRASPPPPGAEVAPPAGVGP